MKLVIVRDLAVGGERAVVAVRLDGHWITLDNRWLILVEDSKVRQMAPLFVLNQSGVRKVVPTIIAVTHPASAPREGAASGPWFALIEFISVSRSRRRLSARYHGG